MHHHSPEDRTHYWQIHIDNWNQCDLSGAAYCEAHGLVYHQFGYWRRKLGKTEGASIAPSSGFSQVVLAPRQCTNGLHLRLPNGVEIHGIGEENIPVVQQLLSRL